MTHPVPVQNTKKSRLITKCLLLFTKIIKNYLYLRKKYYCYEKKQSYCDVLVINIYKCIYIKSEYFLFTKNCLRFFRLFLFKDLLRLDYITLIHNFEMIR